MNTYRKYIKIADKSGSKGLKKKINKYLKFYYTATAT